MTLSLKRKGVTSPAPTKPVQSSKRTDAILAGLLACMVLLILFATGPLVNVPKNDDFSYARTAQALADHGKILYNGWGSPMLWAQAAYGALVIKLWGFSYQLLDLTGILMAGLAAGAFYLLARACGCSRLFAVLATCSLTLNPLFLCVAPSFMTDVPSLLMLLLALLALLNSIRTNADGHISLNPKWFLGSVALALVAGTNRQVSWVAFIGALIPLFLLLPHQRRLLAAALLGVFGCAVGLTLWFSHQPYTIGVDMVGGLNDMVLHKKASLVYVGRLLNMLGLLLVPLALLALPNRWWRSRALWLLAAACLALSLYAYRPHGLTDDLRFVSYGFIVAGQYFTSSGVMIPSIPGYLFRPAMIPARVSFALILLGALGLAAAIYQLCALMKGLYITPKRELTPGYLGAACVVCASVIQIVIMIPWFCQGHVHDRYLLLLILGGLILLAAQATGEHQAVRRVGWVGILILGLGICGFAIASEYMAQTRARARLFNSLLARGIPRQQIDGGFEFNSDTQILIAGYINHDQLKYPPGAYKPNARGKYVQHFPWFYPVMDAYYILSAQANQPASVVLPPPMSSISYYSLLPPHTRKLYVYRIRR